MENNELTIINSNTTGESGQVFAPAQFEHAQRIAKLLSSSDLVPNQYKGNIANTMVALEMAHRMNASPLMVMQNLAHYPRTPVMGIVIYHRLIKFMRAIWNAAV
jgi:hypothetical protein